MNKYQSLFQQKSISRDYRKFEGKIFERNISPVMLQNTILKGFIQRLEQVYVLMINAIKSYKLLNRYGNKPNDYDFN